MANGFDFDGFLNAQKISVKTELTQEEKAGIARGIWETQFQSKKELTVKEKESLKYAVEGAISRAEAELTGKVIRTRNRTVSQTQEVLTKGPKSYTQAELADIAAKGAKAKSMSEADREAYLAGIEKELGRRWAKSVRAKAK